MLQLLRVSPNPPLPDDLPGPDDPADVAIVGGGPIGLELGIRLRAAGVRTVQFEAGPIGATIGWGAPGTRFFSSPERIAIAGVPIPSEDQSKATRERYLAYLRAVVEQFQLPVHAWRRVSHIDGDQASGFRLAVRPSEHGVGGPREWARVRAGDEPVDAEAAAAAGAGIAHARRVVLAIGDMHRPNRLGIPGEEDAHVSHWFTEPHEYFGRRVLVVGGKNSAVEAALRLYRAGVRVAISYRGEAFHPRRVKYWLRPEIEWLIDKGRIDWHPRTVPTAIGRDHVELARVDADGTVIGGGPGRVPADRVLLMTGYRQDASLFEQVGVRLEGEERTPVFDRATMETNVPGVHVAGTACGGSQRRTKYYIENSHVHVDRIVAAVTGRDVAISDPDFAALEES
jgi:thioredoxin reductase (NADPH)